MKKSNPVLIKRLFFGVFSFGQYHIIVKDFLPVWTYYVKIEATSREEARRIMFLNFGDQFFDVYSSEQFTPERRKHYPDGSAGKLGIPQNKYYLVGGESSDLYRLVNALPEKWYKDILKIDKLQNIDSLHNEPSKILDTVVTDGKGYIYHNELPF